MTSQGCDVDCVQDYLVELLFNYSNYSFYLELAQFTNSFQHFKRVKSPVSFKLARVDCNVL